MSKLQKAWIGFVHVQPKRGVNPLGPGLKGAFVHVIALATDQKLYQERARRALDEDGFYVVEFRDICPVSQYRQQGRIPTDMESLISSLSPDNLVQFDTFDAYREYDA